MSKVQGYIHLIALCGMAAAFAGCANVRGFSQWDASPTPATLQEVEQKRQAHLSQVTDTLARVPKSSLDTGAKTSAKEVLFKLKDLNSVTEMGVNYRDYPNYVRDAKFALNRFSSEFGSHKDLASAFQLCLDPYVQAQENYSQYIHMGKGTMGEIEQSFYMKDNWKTGRESIKLVESRFASF